jgi:hypothetical protein
VEKNNGEVRNRKQRISPFAICLGRPVAPSCHYHLRQQGEYRTHLKAKTNGGVNAAIASPEAGATTPAKAAKVPATAG